MQIGKWANLSFLRLSSFLGPQDIYESKRWIVALRDEELKQVEFKGLNIFELCSGTLAARFGSSQIDIKNRNHCQFLRRMLLAALRMCIATRKFNDQYMPQFSIVAETDDFMSKSFFAHSRAQNKMVVPFRWDISARAVRVTHPLSGQYFNCNFVLDEVTSMRADVKTWPSELINVVRDLLAFLDISETQLSLPLAR